jgi:hypothetical protein
MINIPSRRPDTRLSAAVGRRAIPRARARAAGSRGTWQCDDERMQVIEVEP